MYFLKIAIIVNVTDNTIDVVNTPAENRLHKNSISMLIGKLTMKPTPVSMKASFHAALLLKNLVIT